MPGTVKSELLPDADRSHKCNCQEKLVGCKVNLQLFVKVRKDWRNDTVQMKNFGYNVGWKGMSA